MAFSIKELESLSGIKAHTIRIWEQRYHFLKPSRTSTNIRTYSNEELKTILTVALLNKYGYKISRIDEMSPGQRSEEILQIQQTDAYHEHIVNLLIGSMIDLDIHQFETVLNKQIHHHNLHHTIQTIIFYFLERVGILWQTNHIHPAHEHIVSCIIRQKIITAIDALPLTSAPPSFLLFLPEDEYHELGLLYVYYLLKNKNHTVLYLGANVPAKDVYYINEVKQPPYFYLHLTSVPRHFNFQKYITALSAKVPATRILISGSMAQIYRKQLPPNVTLLQSFAEVTACISSL